MRAVAEELYDAATGLPGLALARDRLGVALARSARTAAPVTILHLLVDDTARGDGALLRSIGERLSASVRLADTVARIGDADFLVLCEGMVEMQAGALSDRLRRAVAAAGGDSEVSIGIARSGSASAPDDLLAEARGAAAVDETLRASNADLPPPGPLPHQR